MQPSTNPNCTLNLLDEQKQYQMSNQIKLNFHHQKMQSLGPTI